MSSPAWRVESGHISVAGQQAVAVVTLRRPEKLNALTAGMRRELAAVLRHFGRGDTVRGMVLTGAGRAFSAGEDLHAAAELPPGGLIGEVELFHDITRAVLETRVPVVAADEIVDQADLIETAIRLVHRWTQPGAATTAHLRLLRPPREAVEQAFAAETEAARRADQAGLARGNQPVPQPARSSR